MNTKFAAIGVFASVLLAGCLDSDNDSNATPSVPDPVVNVTETNVRVIHASPDAPTVNVFAGPDAVAGLQDLDYQTGSAWLTLNAGTYALRVEANLPNDEDVEVFAVNTTLSDDTTYNVIAIGSVAGETLAPLVVANPESEVSAGNVRAQVVHAAPAAPEVDVYVTAPDAVLESAQPLATLVFGENTGQVEVPAGEYRIRITAAGTKTAVYDSGTLALAEGSDLLISATQNIATGDSPVALLVATGEGSFVVLDTNSPAELRVVHGVADAPAVDVIANNALTLVDGAAFLDFTPYLSVGAADYLIDVAADEDNSVVVIDDAPVTLMSGVRYTAIANNTLADIDLDLIIDTPRSIATAAQVRIFHASPSAGDVDIYVTADGEIANVDPAFAAIPYSEDVLVETGYVSLAAGDYVVTVTPTGTKTEAIKTGVLSLDAGGIYTAIAVDGSMEGDLPQLIVLDDFVADEAE